MATKSTEALLERKASLEKQLERVNKEIEQSKFVDQLVAGVYVFGKLNDGTAFTHARLLGKTEAQGTAGEWYKLRLNEDTAQEEVKSVRLSNIDGVEAKAEAAATAGGAASKEAKKALEPSDI